MTRRFTEQFKKDALSYVRDHSDQSINACARNLGIELADSKIKVLKSRIIDYPQ